MENEGVSCNQIIASLHKLAFALSEERKVRRKLLPHLNCGADGDYASTSRDKMVESYTFAGLDLQAELPEFIGTAAALPRPYGDMFCYIVYCDLHQRMRMYQQLAKQLVGSQESAANCVAVPS
jgi:hypothetical protein